MRVCFYLEYLDLLFSFYSRILHSWKTPQMRDKKNLKYVKNCDKSNTEFNINTCIIKLQTFTFNV